MQDSNKFFKLRKLTSNNKTGDAMGITLPRHVSERFKETHFQITIVGDSVLLESGCPAQ